MIDWNLHNNHERFMKSRHLPRWIDAATKRVLWLQNYRKTKSIELGLMLLVIVVIYVLKEQP